MSATGEELVTIEGNIPEVRYQPILSLGVPLTGFVTTIESGKQHRIGKCTP